MRHGIVKNVNSVSNEELDVIYNKIDEFNKTRVFEANGIHREYYISTGKKNALFTLRVYCFNADKKDNYSWSYDSYICTLGKDFKESVDKALARMENSPWVITINCDSNCEYDYSGDIFQFGKYKGQSISDIAATDIKYLIWCNSTKNEVLSRYKNAPKHLVANYEHIESQINFYYDTIRKENLATCKSNWVGEKGGHLHDVEVVVTKSFIDNRELEGETSITVEGIIGEDIVTFYLNKGNEYYKAEMTTNGKYRSVLENGSVIKIARARVASTFEKLGKKMTRLNYIKFAA